MAIKFKEAIWAQHTIWQGLVGMPVTNSAQTNKN